MDFRDLPTLFPKKHKLLAAILLLMEEAAKVGLKLSKGEIVKSLFLADDRHLAQYGRPITFDNYVAMKNGPVGDLASDMLNDRPNVRWSDFNLDRAPWSQEHLGDRTFYRSQCVTADRRKLSPSDVDALRAALDHVVTAGFLQISKETHTHPAWAAAWSAKADCERAAAMDWRDFPDVDAALASDLVMASWNAG
jgi:hypothetical protein